MSRSIPVLIACLFVAACAAPDGESSSAAAAPAPKPVACQPGPAPTQVVSRDVTPGSGEPVTVGTAVLVNYTGWLYDPCAPEQKGKQFDTSEGKPTPLGFMLGAGRVIKGWDEGIVGMRDGGKRVLLIPADKAYGEKGTPDGAIPPNAALLFEVTLVKIVYRPPAAAAPAK